MTEPARACLLVLSGPRQGERFDLTALTERSPAGLTFGRVPGAGIDVVLADATISRRHCHLARSGSDYLLEDRYSAGGTFVNDERCSSRVLADGDVVSIGACKMQFTISKS